MTHLSKLYRERRDIRRTMKESGIKRMCCMNRMDAQAFHYNRLADALDNEIRKAKTDR